MRNTVDLGVGHCFPGSPDRQHLGLAGSSIVHVCSSEGQLIIVTALCRPTHLITQLTARAALPSSTNSSVNSHQHQIRLCLSQSHQEILFIGIQRGLWPTHQILHLLLHMQQTQRQFPDIVSLLQQGNDLKESTTQRSSWCQSTTTGIMVQSCS